MLEKLHEDYHFLDTTFSRKIKRLDKEYQMKEMRDLITEFYEP